MTYKFCVWVCVSLATAHVQASDIDVDSGINAVTVFRDGATISRQGTTTVPAGEHRLVVRGLPSDIAPQKFRLNVSSSAITIGALDFERITENKLVSAEERALTSKQQSLQDQIAALDDEIATAQLQLRILDGLGNVTQSGEPAVTGANIPTALASAGQGSLAARARVRDANTRKRGVLADLTVVNADLAKITSGRKSYTQVMVNILASQPVSAAVVTLNYESDGAQWAPSYTARLDSAASKLALLEQASLEQSTGEDWKKVALTLSSGRPSEAMAPESLPSLFVDVQEPQVLQKQSAPKPGAAGFARERSLSRNDESAEIIVTGTRSEADVVAGSYAVEYKIPGRSTVESDREPRLFPIAETNWDVKIVARAVPRIDTTAFAQATFTNNSKAPIRGGDMQIFRDGGFAGVAKFRTALPGQAATLALGSDERIRLRVENEAEESGKQGTFKKEIVDETRLRFEITSYHDKPVVLEVLDRVPVPRSKDIKVEMIKGSTEPTETRFEGRAGVYVWRLTLDPRKTVTIRHAYAVRYPKGMILSEDEVDAPEADDPE
jgi:uncharacterized protein (TIGR02231 family)